MLTVDARVNFRPNSDPVGVGRGLGFGAAFSVLTDEADGTVAVFFGFGCKRGKTKVDTVENFFQNLYSKE